MAEIPAPGIGRKISVVLPAYNEEDNIERQVRSVDEVLHDMQFDDYEVLVVDDGSRDGTRAVCEAMGESVPRLRLLVHEVNLGYAAALRTGFTGAAMPLVFYTDADNQFDVRELKNLLPGIDDYDIVCGFRIYRFDPFSRLVLSWGYNLLVRVLFGIRVRDVDCAFKLFRREVECSQGSKSAYHLDKTGFHVVDTRPGHSAFVDRDRHFLESPQRPNGVAVTQK